MSPCRRLKLTCTSESWYFCNFLFDNIWCHGVVASANYDSTLWKCWKNPEKEQPETLSTVLFTTLMQKRQKQLLQKFWIIQFEGNMHRFQFAYKTHVFLSIHKTIKLLTKKHENYEGGFSVFLIVFSKLSLNNFIYNIAVIISKTSSAHCRWHRITRTLGR